MMSRRRSSGTAPLHLGHQCIHLTIHTLCLLLPLSLCVCLLLALCLSVPLSPLALLL
jgi:hypothetical protein